MQVALWVWGRVSAPINLPTPCVLRCCNVLTGVLTLGFDMSCQGCQSVGTGPWEEPAGLRLGNICLVKHLWLL